MTLAEARVSQTQPWFRRGLEAWTRFMDSWLTTGTAVIIDPYAELGF